MGPGYLPMLRYCFQIHTRFFFHGWKYPLEPSQYREDIDPFFISASCLNHEGESKLWWTQVSETIQNTDLSLNFLSGILMLSWASPFRPMHGKTAKSARVAHMKFAVGKCSKDFSGSHIFLLFLMVCGDLFSVRGESEIKRALLFLGRLLKVFKCKKKMLWEEKPSKAW